MLKKSMKGLLIVVLGLLLVVAGVSVWAIRNQEYVFEQIKAYINESIDGQLEVKKFTFSPLRKGLGFTFSLHDITLDDTLFSVHRTHLLQARRLNVTLDLREFLTRRIKVRRIAVEDGTATVFIRRDGYTNASVLTTNPKDTTSKKKSSTSDLFSGIRELSFQNFALHYADSLRSKYHAGTFREVTSQLVRKDSVWRGDMEGAVYFKGLTFHPKKGAFMKQQESTLEVAFSYNQATRELQVHPSWLEVATGHRIKMSGLFDLAGKPGKVKMDFTTDTIALPTALKLLPAFIEKTVTRVKILPVVKAHVHLEGFLGTGTPRVDIAYRSGHFDYNLPFGKLKKVKAVGTFTNQANRSLPPSDENSQLKGTQVQGFFETIPLEGTIVINDLWKPKAIIESTMKASPANLNALLDPARYQVRSGSIDIGFRYQGNLMSFYDPNTNRPTAKLGGQIVLQNLAFSYLPQGVDLSRIQGSISINEDEFASQDLRFSDGKNTYFMTGKATDLLTQIMGAKTTPKAVVHVQVPNWQLNWLDFFLKKKSPEETLVNPNFKLSQTLDKVIDRTEVVASVESNQVSYKRFQATQVRGKMTLTDTKVNLNDISMNAFGGTLKVSGYIDNIGTNGLPFLHAQGQLNRTDVQSVFYSLNNLGQKAITDQNIQGKLDADFVFESTLRDNATLLAESMRGKLDIALTNAEVRDFEPFQKMKNILFRKRNFDQVRFAPIRKQFFLNGQEIEVKEMEIESNIFTLFVNGTYSFGRKTDLSIQIPLQNLKRRDSTYQLAQHDLEYMKGANVFLRAVDEGGEVNIKYDPLKKFRKDDKALKQEEGQK